MKHKIGDPVIVKLSEEQQYEDAILHNRIDRIKEINGKWILLESDEPADTPDSLDTTKCFQGRREWELITPEEGIRQLQALYDMIPGRIEVLKQAQESK